MWFESQNCAMMGLQATTGKRKLEAATAPGDSSPAKNGRWDADDCIARLQAVAVPGDAWRAPTPSLAATLLSNDDFDDDDEFEDELSDDDRCSSHPEPARYSSAHHHHHQQQQTQQQQSYLRYSNDYWQYYQPPQQTIRCEENARFRQCSDPSLRRSVLICNTLRKLEREMESEPPEPCYPTLPEMTSPSRLSPVPEVSSYEQSLREMTSSSGRATPFPQANSPDTDSGIGDDETTRPINWGSVLSLTSQTDLESLNNNELYAELGLNSDSDYKDPLVAAPRNENEWDGFMHVLVGGS
ncbi:hypothetical protein Trydic_g4476 [Trypoxylus dichotomus]